MNVDDIMAEVGLVKKSPREKIVPGGTKEGCTAIYIDEDIVRKGRKWLETEDFSLEMFISHHIATVAIKKEREHHHRLEEERERERNNTFNIDNYYRLPKEKRSIWDKLYVEHIENIRKNIAEEEIDERFLEDECEFGYY